MSNKPTPSETLASNLEMLLDLVPEKKSVDWLARRSGVSKRMIQYLLKCERTATIDTIEALAKPFHLAGWQLLISGLRADLINDGRIPKLIENFANSSNEGRLVINRIAEQEAKYGNDG